MALVKCETDGCGARVTRGVNTHCVHCRPRIRSPNEKSYDSPEKRAKQKAARRRRRDAAGVLWC